MFFINRYFYPDESATSQLLSDLAFGLAKRDYDVHVLCSRQLYNAADAKLSTHETIRGVEVHRLLTTRFGRRVLIGRALDYLSFYITCAFSLAWLLRGSDVVVAKTDPPLISVIAAGVARLKKGILINWLQDVFPEVASLLGANPLPHRLDMLMRRLRDTSLRAAAVNVVLGERMKQYLLSRDIPEQSIEIIENWAATDAGEPKITSDSFLRARLGLKQKFIVGYSGNLGRAHEYATLLGAAELLRDDGDVVFLMIGAGANMDALQSKVKDRQLPNVRFLPYQPRQSLSDSLAAPDMHLVSLIPALEGLIVPSKFYGILAAGRPVVFIGDENGELAHIIRETRCGLVVAQGQSVALLHAIRYLQLNGREREAMAEASRKLLCTRYSAGLAQERWVRLLGRLQADKICA